MFKHLCIFLVVLACVGAGATQQAQPPAKTPPPNSPAAPAAGAQHGGVDTTAKSGQPDKASAYYHYSLAHIYEELVAMYGRSEYANRAIEEYRLAIENDPSSEFLN